MELLSFHGLGTEWSILVDVPRVSPQEKQIILDYAKRFEQRFSRFLPDSEVNVFRESAAGEYEISEEFFLLLERADRLRELTRGAYDPAAGGLLERAGYGKISHLDGRRVRVEDFVLPRWSLSGRKLVIDGPTSFDLGGIGKGYCIDRISELIRDFGHEFFLVEGGGDMFGTTKSDGSPWLVAIEYPGKPDTAAGETILNHQGLAVSDRFRRRFGTWHHIVNWKEKKPRDTIIGCAAITPNAWAADCVTSGLFLASEEIFPRLAQAFQAEYVVFYPDGRVTYSPYWDGRLFV